MMSTTIQKTKRIEYYAVSGEVQVCEGFCISLHMYLGPEADHRRGLHSFKGLCLAGSIQLELCDSLPECGFKEKVMPLNCSMEQLVQQVLKQRHGIR
jgi:hypothetical protein